jgi:DnaJ-class molecular chaperone
MFSNIKYNLYEILNVSQSCNENIIKKSYLKLIKKFHPDKNNIIEEEIYYHIMYANQILTNKELREKYNDFIRETQDFNKLKLESKKDLDINKVSKAESLIIFNNKVNELNNKHGFTDDLNIKKEKKREELTIKKEINPKDIKEFNQIFLKKKNSCFKDQIIEYKGEPMEITTYNSNNNYSFISDIEKLYIDDKIGNNSLDIVYSLQPFIEI